MKDRFASLSPRERILAILTGLSAVGFLVWIAVVAPRVQEMKSLGREKEALGTEIADLQARLAALPPRSVAGSRAGEAGLGRASLSSGFETLERLAGRHQIDLTAVKMSPPEDQGGYTVYPAEIDLVGRYRNVVEFLEVLERLPGWIQVRGVRMEENPETAPRVQIHLAAMILNEKDDAKP